MASRPRPETVLVSCDSCGGREVHSGSRGDYLSGDEPFPMPGGMGRHAELSVKRCAQCLGRTGATSAVCPLCVGPAPMATGMHLHLYCSDLDVAAAYCCPMDGCGWVYPVARGRPILEKR